MAFCLCLVAFLAACTEPAATEPAGENTQSEKTEHTDNFVWSPESFSDKRMIRYQIPGFDKLTLEQKKLVYYLTQAGLSGRDIMYDMNYRHNLAIVRVINKIAKDYSGDKISDEWTAFMTYAKKRLVL